MNCIETRHLPPVTCRHGFSFVEVLFAVMILGIGFIMIAGIFPVAINQAQTSADESIGASIARGGVNYLASLSDTALLMDPAGTGVMVPLSGQLLERLRGNMIIPEDPRYGWVGFYRAAQLNRRHAVRQCPGCRHRHQGPEPALV